jgi:hypothetical protein
MDDAPALFPLLAEPLLAARPAGSVAFRPALVVSPAPAG